MSFLKKIFNSTSNSSTKTEEKVKNVITAFAKTETGKTKEEKMVAPKPKIKAVTWVGKDGSKQSKAKYGKQLSLHIDTEEAYGSLSALIVIHSDYWKEDYVALRPITKHELFRTGETDELGVYRPNPNAPEKTIFSFTPNVEQIDPHLWANRKSDESQITTKIYLIYYFSYSSTEDNSYHLKQLAEAIKRDDNDIQNHTTGNVSKPHIIAEKESKQIEISKIVIVIDPGHGVKPAENESGSQARKYKYKIMEEDHSGNLIDTKKQTQNYVTVDRLPQYVLDAPKTYIVAKTSDDDRCEYQLSFDIAVLMITMLRNEGYIVINTRETREYWKTGKDKKYAITYRWKIANDNKADYFISLHADGASASQDIDTTRGAHVVYNNGDNIGKKFATDLFKYYTAVPIVGKHPDPRTNVGVVGSSNKTKYKALIEFGFMAQPKDSHIMHTQQPQIAEQIVRALIEHINQKFE